MLTTVLPLPQHLANMLIPAARKSNAVVQQAVTEMAGRAQYATTWVKSKATTIVQVIYAEVVSPAVTNVGILAQRVLLRLKSLFATILVSSATAWAVLVSFVCKTALRVAGAGMAVIDALPF